LNGPNAPVYAKPSGPGDDLASMVEYAYDNLGRVTQIDRWHFVGSSQVSAAKLAVTTTYAYSDKDGTMTVNVDGRPGTVTHFDGAQRVIERTFPDSLKETFQFADDPSGDRITESFPGEDGVTHSLVRLIDDYGRLREVRDVKGRVLQSNRLDAFGRAHVQSVGGQSTELSFDGFDQLRKVIEPSGQVATNARVVERSFDGNGRMVSCPDS
jgi:hypothetical protein